MGKGGQQIAEPQEVKDYTWTEVKKHQTKNDKWLVIDGEVYDITTWARRHPGGSKVISHYAGQDATVSESINSIFNQSSWQLNQH